MHSYTIQLCSPVLYSDIFYYLIILQQETENSVQKILKRGAKCKSWYMSVQERWQSNILPSQLPLLKWAFQTHLVGHTSIIFFIFLLESKKVATGHIKWSYGPPQLQLESMFPFPVLSIFLWYTLQVTYTFPGPWDYQVGWIPTKCRGIKIKLCDGYVT